LEGHIAHGIENDTLRKLPQGKNLRGKPRKRWMNGRMDRVEKDLERLSVEKRKYIAQDRDRWQGGSQNF